MLRKDFTKQFSILKEKYGNSLITYNAKDDNEQIDILCGKPLHTTYSKSYYFDTSYIVFSNREEGIVIDESHMVMLHSRWMRFLFSIS